LKIITNQSEIGVSLPILAQEYFLKTKSDNYGYFMSDNFVLPFFLETRNIFVRMVFTTGIIRKHDGLSLDDEKNFLDSVVDYTRQHRLCDFIYKPQANAVFNVCPKDGQCIQWGTYVINLDKTEEELFGSFNQKARNLIRKSIKLGTVVEMSYDISLVYEMIKRTLVREKSLHYPSYTYLKKLSQLKENVVFLTAKLHNNIEGALVLLYDEKCGYALYAGRANYSTAGSIELLHFEAMKFLQTKNILIYDFVGTRINIKKGTKQERIDKFKKKFNPKLIQGYSFEVAINPIKYFFYSNLVQIYFKLHNIDYRDPVMTIKAEEKEHNILILGPRYDLNNITKSMSGTVVLFEDLINQFHEKKVNYDAIDTNKYNYINYKLAYLIILLKFLNKARYAKYISLHSSQDFRIFGVLFIIYAKLFNKKISLRKFGGDLKDVYLSANIFKKYYLNYILSHMDILFVETKYLVSFFSQINKNTVWFSNVRNRTFEVQLPRKYSKKFVFISHVIKTKGIEEILEASKKLDKSYTIDIYGPLFPGEYTEEDFKNYANLTYKGPLQANKVIKHLNKYDVVLLPSYKEGYPGIVIEAYSLGIPSITTNLDSIQEIVKDYETGILISPRNTTELVNAMKYFNKENYQKISKNAYCEFDKFDSKKITKGYISRVFH